MAWTMSWLSIVLQLVPLLLLAYLYIKRKYSYWSSRGISGPKPMFPLGYLYERAITQPPDFELKMAKNHGRIYGLYSGLLPTLTVNDADLIKQILVKDFPQFINRRSLNAYHELWNDNLFSAESTIWKRVRTITSPTFSTGKLRGMYPLMNRCVDRFTLYLDKITSTGSGEISVREVVTGFTVDVVASTSFATETETNGDRSKMDDPLLRNSLKIFEFNGMRIAAVYALPRLVLNTLNIRTWFDPACFEYFIELTRQIIRQRKQEDSAGSKVKRNDFVQILVDSFVYDDDLKDADYSKLTASANYENSTKEEANGITTDLKSNSAKQSLTENEIIAQSILFFAAGFETTSSTITNCLFEMTHNPDLQERLHNELEENLGSLDTSTSAGSRDYFDIINQLPYLDAYIKETLRRYPAAIRLERRLTGESGYKLGGIPLEKGTLIEISIYAVHHDPEYFPDPFKFDPERFMPENKHQIKPYTYIPFGSGPRNCIGMRFAYQEIKLCLAKIVRKYRFEATPQTPTKLQFKPGSLLLNVEPFPIRVCRR